MCLAQSMVLCVKTTLCSVYLKGRNVNWSLLITHQHWLEVKLQCFGVDLVGYIQEQNRVPIPQLILITTFEY